MKHIWSGWQAWPYRGGVTLALFILTLIMLSYNIHAMQAADAVLTLIVRDEAGTPVADVHVQLFADRFGRAEPAGHGATDAAGELVFTELAPGMTYIAQLHGLPSGRPMQPIAEQNGGMRVDGGGTQPGFGIHLEGQEATQLFVLTGMREADPGIPARPYFDLAASIAEPPRPVRPPETADEVVLQPSGVDVEQEAVGVSASSQAGWLLLWIALMVVVGVAGVLAELWRQRRARA